MRPCKLFAVVLVLGLATAGAAWADDVIRFKNGAHLPVRAHEIKDDMVVVTLASESQMAFPMRLVESIESGGKAVFPSPTANQAVAGAPRGTVSLDNPPAGAQRYSGASSRSSGGSSRGRSQSTTSDSGAGGGYTGLVGGGSSGAQDQEQQSLDSRVGRPFADSPNPSRREFTVVGDQTLVPAQNTVGRKQVLNDAPPGRRNFTPITIRPKAAPALAPPPPPPPQEGQSEAPPASASEGGASSDSGSSTASGEE